MIYSWRYPESIHRSVMIGVNPPGHFLWDPKTTDEQIRHYSALCAKDDSCSTRTDDLAASMRRTAADIPDHWWFLPIKTGNVRIASFFGLMESTSEAAPISAPMTLDSWLSAAQRRRERVLVHVADGRPRLPRIVRLGRDGSRRAGSTPAPRRPTSRPGEHDDSILGNPATEFIWGGGRSRRCVAGQPRATTSTAGCRHRTVQTLLIGGTLDFATPPNAATDELLPHLPNGHQVVLAELGHTTDFWTYQPEASSRLVNTFFDSGKVDDSLYTPTAIDFTPEVTHTALAKGIAGTMVGLAILAVLSLLWMAVRVHKRGGFGRKASASLRSLYPLVLGLGGWFLGALIVMTTLPGVPLDDELLAALSIGIPIGLGIYWAWVHRDWSANAKTAGFVAAAAGALVGAWLGFNATTGLLALITTIVGATAGANLSLIVLDMTRERSTRSPVICGESGEPWTTDSPRGARPSVGAH